MYGVRNGKVATVNELLSDAKDDLRVQRWSLRELERKGEAFYRTADEVHIRLTRCLVEVFRYKRMLITEQLARGEMKARDDSVRQETRLRHWRLIRAINAALVNLGVDDLGVALER